MANLLMPSGSADFRSLATKPGGAKAGTAMLMPYGDAADTGLVAMVGNGGGGKLAPYGSAAHLGLVAKEGGAKGGTAPLMPYGELDDTDLAAKVGTNGGGGKAGHVPALRRVIRLNARG
jgi:hypothetical protein